MKKKIFIIDGSAVVYRSHYAFVHSPLTDDKGKVISAIYGTFNMFFKFIKDFDPKYLAVTFDQKGGSFRNKVFSEYKANRPPMPQELIRQIEIIQEIFCSLGIVNLKKENYEADDVIGSFATELKKDSNVVIISGDKDFYQLIDENITMFDPSKNLLIDSNSVQEKLGIKPWQMVDYLAIVGDSADNIPGVAGIGKIGAKKLLNQFNSLNNIYENISSVLPASTQKKLLESKEKAFLSQRLAQIVTNLELDCSGLEFDKSKLAQLETLLAEQQLYSLAKRAKTLFLPAKPFKKQSEEMQMTLFQEEPYETEKGKEEEFFDFDFEVVDNEAKLQVLQKKIEDEKIIVIDTETDGLDPLLNRLVGVSFCFSDEKCFYFPLQHPEFGWSNKKLKRLLRLLKDKLIIGHNLKFDFKFLQKYISLDCLTYFDTMVAAYLFNPGKSKISLSDCVFREFNKKMIDYEEVTQGKRFSEVLLQKAAKYSCEDVFTTYKLYGIYKPKLEKKKLVKLFSEIEMPLLQSLAQIELAGVFVDKNILHLQEKSLQDIICQLEEKIYTLAGVEFNLNSPKQMQEVLYKKLKLPAKSKTKTGFSTSESALEGLVNEHSIVKYILEFRTASKLLNTYILSLPKLINHLTGRIHTNFNQTITSTGRLSSSHPNMQNIPIKSDAGKNIRKAFVAQSEDFCILAADYSQMELRILAALSQDPQLLETFQKGEDVHTQTAKKIFEVDEVSKLQRALAKTINFGVVYGMGARALSRTAGITTIEAKDFIEKYFQKFTVVHSFIKSQIEKSKQTEIAYTFFGRALPLPEINSLNQRLRAQAERIAVNMPIQGTAADIIKLAMIKLNKVLPNDAQIVLQVHDELVFEVPKAKVEFLVPLIKKEMEYIFDCGVKLSVNLKYADNWLDAH